MVYSRAPESHYIYTSSALKKKSSKEINNRGTNEIIAMFSEENYVPPNPPIGSGDRVQTRLIFTVFIV